MSARTAGAARDAARPAGLAGLPEVGPRARRRRRWVLPILAAVTVLVVAGLATRPVAGIPGDPRSTSYGGLRGILDVAGSLDRQVDISVELPVDATTTYLVIRDDLTPRQRDVVRAWVERGGRLVVADPGSPLAGAEVEGTLVTDVLGATSFDAACDLLPGVGRVRSSAWTALVPPPGADVCIRLGERGAWLVREPSGAGEVITIGGPGPLANEHLPALDNALAGVALLAPDASDVLLVRPLPAPGTGDEGLLTLVPRRVRHLLAALGLVYGVLVWWRSRRHGPPVPEPLPLRVPGAAIVDGVAGLLQRSGDRDSVAEAIVEDLRARLAREVGTGRGRLADDELATLAAARLGLDGDAVATTLGARVDTDDDLLALARRCGGLHTAIGARRSSPAARSAGPTVQRPTDDGGAAR